MTVVRVVFIYPEEGGGREKGEERREKEETQVEDKEQIVVLLGSKLKKGKPEGGNRDKYFINVPQMRRQCTL